MKNLFNILTLILLIVTTGFASNNDKKPEGEKTTLITNVNIFDGNSKELIKGKSVVIQGNKIIAIIPEGAKNKKYDVVIDGHNGYLTPGLIDAHFHSVMGMKWEEFVNGDQAYVQLFASRDLKEALMRGVTTVRDAAGNTFALKKAIDEGIIDGPRIYPSGAIITQYSGHADLRTQDATNLPKEWGGELEPAEKAGHMLLANGKQQVTAATRQQLFLGATQIKIAVSGGVSSFTDPLYVLEYSDEEIKAAVDAANDFGTYVLAHAHAGEGVVRAVRNGVKSIEHGSMLNEEAAELMALNNCVYIPQVEVYYQLKPVYTDPVRKAKLENAMNAVDKSMKLAKENNILIGYGTDLIFSYEGRQKQLVELSRRKEWFNSDEIMIQATGNGGKIVAMSGKRNPYGAVGVIKEGAMADILIYSKNPLKDVSVVEDYENNLNLIMKDGKVYKNTIK